MIEAESDDGRRDSLVGYQEIVDWRGERVLTLAELWPDRPRAMIVGLNPAPPSVAVGHYYQGRSGRRQLERLARAGLFAIPKDGTFEQVALAERIGFTDIVRRPTVGERDVRVADLEHGRDRLIESIRASGVPLVICVFRQPVEALLGGVGGPGFQSAAGRAGPRVFRMPGPFDAATQVESVMSELRDCWRGETA